MEVLAFIVVGVIFLVAKMFYDANRQKKDLLYRLKKEFGCVPKKEYTAEKYEAIQKYYYANANSERDVDDITWNDVDMDDIFMLMNNTCTSIGEEYLFASLRKLKQEDIKLKEIDRLADYFATHEDERVALQYKLMKIGQTNRISIFEYINLLDGVKEESVLIHVVQALGLVLAPFLTIFDVTLGIFAIFGMIALNMITYFKAKKKMENYLLIVNYISRIMISIDDINKDKCDVIAPIMKEINQYARPFKEFKLGSFWVGRGSADMKGDLMDLVLDYIRMLLHVDIIIFYRLVKIFREHKEELNGIYERIGFMDSCIAIASFREMLPYYSKPVLVHQRKPVIEAEEIYHVMIANPVVNSIHENKSVLITGSNASGKSTFIKTLAINAILSQTIYTSLSKSYYASYFIVASSMALRDDILSKESYYIVEIKSLKRIMDRLNDEIPMLCFVDEVLRGTNTLERIAASSEILYSLAHANALCFAATHDIELTHILEDSYSNYHFQEQIVDNNILFDYKLYKGRAVSKNAIKLLGIMGYSDGIINKATNAANYFLETGEWKKR